MCVKQRRVVATKPIQNRSENKVDRQLQSETYCGQRRMVANRPTYNRSTKITGARFTSGQRLVVTNRPI